MNPTEILEKRSDEAQLPTPNLPLLRKVLEQIDSDPTSWCQTSWARKGDCGTAFCIAGHVANLCGEIVWGSSTGDGRTVFGDDVYIAGEDVTPIHDFARHELGLTWHEGSCTDGGLFNPFNSRADVQRIAEAIAARAGETL